MIFYLFYKYLIVSNILVTCYLFFLFIRPAIDYYFLTLLFEKIINILLTLILSRLCLRIRDAC